MTDVIWVVFSLTLRSQHNLVDLGFLIVASDPLKDRVKHGGRQLWASCKR